MGNKNTGAGRPTGFKPEYIQQAAKLCLLGAIDKDIAEFFGTSVVTLNAWKKKYPEFLKSLKDAKAEADARVVRSLYQRAVGYEGPAVKIFNANGSALVVPYTEHYPPETAAGIFWLKNRDPENWRDRHEVTGANGKPVGGPTFALDSKTAAAIAKKINEDV
ncbi:MULTISPECIES: helix-turn-helix domain-containing protein [unclassified Bradyrhizobium]|uniref:helix-turn-helix domain-containing protein n=1 Tax=unclassified Bradyrhizobium TaxID=2631580 RepID=UPI001BACD87B|nr:MULTISPECIES: helix-turn-helix domain-containing protein [unclassified Bradyrhizobium]MBR1154347.1 terminase [Bradyrhizobium sp. JYMT SZCCT0428]MBR1267265.1 terminase [Bradyrhizobium sp. AUGA SZCCT0222]